MLLPLFQPHTQVGSKREFAFDVKDHVALGEALGILDFETASEVSRKPAG